MKLVELAYFTERVQQMADFYQVLLGAEPVAFAVAAKRVDATCETFVKQGLTLEVPPKDYYWGRSAYLRNPDGYLVEITRA